MTDKFQPKKSLGQNFLTSDYVPKKMCDAANLQAGDLVVEIGPGTGVLTKEILQRGARVIALEADKRAVTRLQDTFPQEIQTKHLSIHHTDVRELDLTTLEVEAGKYSVIANIPYYLSGMLLRTFLESDTQPHTLVFLMQKELVERIARDEKESLLSLSVKAFGEPAYVGTIKPGHFTPPPKVDSAILAVTNISQVYFDRFSPETFFTIIKAGFAKKRKQLAPNLRSLFDPAVVKKALAESNLSPTSRAEDIPLEKWKELIVRLTSTR